jgi:hypothetical protein
VVNITTDTLNTYSNLFFRFSYPPSYEIEHQNSIEQHSNPGSSYDAYGLASVTLVPQTTGVFSYIRVESLPNPPGSTATSELNLERQRLQDNFATGDTLETITVNTKQALHYFQRRSVLSDSFRPGKRMIFIPTDKYNYRISMLWSGTGDANIITSQVHKEFDKIVQSFSIITGP